MPVEAVIAAAKAGGFRQIAYTYSEPLVHGEFLLDCMAAAHESGIANVLVSNGCAGPDAARDILSLTDAANIDLKAFSPETYARVLGGDLNAVLDCIRAARALGILLEVTTLIVPGLNDGEAETAACADFLAGLSPEIPWHLSAYHPDYCHNAPPTDPQALLKAAQSARRRLRYVYTGNIPCSRGFEDTPCAFCGALLVRRRGFRAAVQGIRREAGAKNYVCAACGRPTPIRS
jgi:pyruvate formate lyase activating enzyme